MTGRKANGSGGGSLGAVSANGWRGLGRGLVGAGPVEGGARGRRRRRRRLQQRRRRPRQKRPGSRQVRSVGLWAGGGQAGRGRVRGGPTCWQRSRCVPGPASGCAHGASERGAGRAPSAHRRRRSRPSVPLSLRVAGLEPRAAPELRDFTGEESAVECARAAGTRVAGRTPRLERWRAGGGAAVGQVGRGPLAGGGRRCAGGTREASPRLLPGLGFLHLKEAASGTPLPPPTPCTPRWGLGALQVCQVLSGKHGVKCWQLNASRARFYFSKPCDPGSAFMAYIRN